MRLLFATDPAARGSEVKGRVGRSSSFIDESPLSSRATPAPSRGCGIVGVSTRSSQSLTTPTSALLTKYADFKINDDTKGNLTKQYTTKTYMDCWESEIILDIYI